MNSQTRINRMYVEEGRRLSLISYITINNWNAPLKRKLQRQHHLKVSIIITYFNRNISILICLTTSMAHLSRLNFSSIASYRFVEFLCYCLQFFMRFNITEKQATTRFCVQHLHIKVNYIPRTRLSLKNLMACWSIRWKMVLCLFWNGFSRCLQSVKLKFTIKWNYYKITEQSWLWLAKSQCFICLVICFHQNFHTIASLLLHEFKNFGSIRLLEIHDCERLEKFGNPKRRCYGHSHDALDQGYTSPIAPQSLHFTHAGSNTQSQSSIDSIAEDSHRTQVIISQPALHENILDAHGDEPEFLQSTEISVSSPLRDEPADSLMMDGGISYFTKDMEYHWSAYFVKGWSCISDPTILIVQMYCLMVSSSEASPFFTPTAQIFLCLIIETTMNGLIF